MIRVLLADDHAIVIEGLRALLDGEPDMKVAAWTTDGTEVVKLVEQHKPDVVVLDLELTSIKGTEVIAALRDLHVNLWNRNVHQDGFDECAPLFVRPDRLALKRGAKFKASVLAERPVRLAGTAEVRENMEVTTVEKSAWKDVKAVKSSAVISDALTGNVVSRDGVEMSDGKAAYISTRLKVEAGTITEVELSSDLARANPAYVWNLPPVLTATVPEGERMTREALDALRRLYRGNNDTGKLYDVLQRLHESSPNEAPITADLARLGLNLERNIERSHALAKEAYDRAPNEVNCAVTYAFSLYRLSRSPEALAIIQGLPADQLRDPHAAVYTALMLADSSQIDAAKDYVDAADHGIYPEEKTVLEEARTKISSASAAPSPASSPVPAQSSPKPASTPQPIL